MSFISNFLVAKRLFTKLVACHHNLPCHSNFDLFIISSTGFGQVGGGGGSPGRSWNARHRRGVLLTFN